MLSRWHPIWLRCKGADPNGVAAYDVKGSCSTAALYSRASISEPDYYILPLCTDAVVWSSCWNNYHVQCALIIGRSLVSCLEQMYLWFAECFLQIKSPNVTRPTQYPFCFVFCLMLIMYVCLCMYACMYVRTQCWVPNCSFQTAL
jgi:hypothetical protein